MRLDQRSSLVVLTIIVVGLAFAAGLAIPLASGGAKGSAAPPGWTPPPTTSATVRPTLTRWPTIPTLAAATATTTATATRQPTPTRPAATATSRPTSTPTPTVVVTPTETPRATATTAPTAAAGVPLALVREGPLALRTGPGRDQPLMAVAQVGETFTVTGRTNDNLWLQLCCVRTNPAWAFAEYLTITGTITSLPIKP